MARAKWMGKVPRPVCVRACAAAFALGSVAGVVASLTGCTETSLNEAPVVDLSTQARTNMPPVRGGMDAASVAVARDAAMDIYTVQKGDTLFRIASMFHVGVPDIARWNGIEESAPISVGQRLRVRGPAPAAEAQGQTPAAAAAEPAAPAEAEVRALPLAATTAVETRALDATPPMAPSAETAAPVAAPQASTAGSTGAGATPASAADGRAPIVAAPSAPAPAVPSAPAGIAATETAPTAQKAIPSAPWVWPVSGRVTAKFDPVRTKGIEIAAAEGADVVAVADGEVSYTGSPRDYGNLVILRHPDGILSVYAHNKSILVKQGQAVMRGQPIATAGRTGTDPPRLHFEVRRRGNPVDPLEFLPAR